MKEIKTPKWDKPISEFSTVATYDKNKSMPLPPKPAVGMTAYAKLHDVLVKIKVQKIVNENDIEGEIININSESETINDLSVNNSVFVKYGYYSLNQDIQT